MAPTKSTTLAGAQFRARYIVVLKNTTLLRTPSQVDSAARDLASRYQGRLGHIYHAALRGFAVDLSAASWGTGPATALDGVGL